MSWTARDVEMEMRLREMAENPEAYRKKCRSRNGWAPDNERDRRALAILNDPTVPANTRHILAKGIHLLHKLERMTKQ